MFVEFCLCPKDGVRRMYGSFAVASAVFGRLARGSAFTLIALDGTSPGASVGGVRGALQGEGRGPKDERPDEG